jgi:hypothetical protein
MNSNNGRCGFLLTPYSEPVFDSEGIYNSRQNWWKVDINQMRRYMRNAYNGKNKEYKVNGVERGFEYSMENIGNKFLEILNN